MRRLRASAGRNQGGSGGRRPRSRADRPRRAAAAAAAMGDRRGLRLPFPGGAGGAGGSAAGERVRLRGPWGLRGSGGSRGVPAAWRSPGRAAATHPLVRAVGAAAPAASSSRVGEP